MNGSAVKDPQGLYIDGRPFDESAEVPVTAAKTLVYIFTATKCPIANRYAPEIKRIREECESNGQQLFVVYADPDAELLELKKHADDYGYSEFALWDHEQQIADHHGAHYTPEAVVIFRSKRNPQGSVVYRGRIDDWYAAFGKPKAAAQTHDLRDVLKQLREETADESALKLRETKVIGCPIPRLPQSPVLKTESS